MSLSGGRDARTLLALLTLVITTVALGGVAAGSMPAAIQAPGGARAPQTARPSAESTGSIAGRVTTADDRRPIARARVVVTSATLPNARVVLTGPDGAFDVPRLPPGSYSVHVSYTGYVGVAHGDALDGPAHVVTLGSGQRAGDLAITLRRAGVLSGVVLDEDGKPYGPAVVRALAARMDGARRTVVPVAQVETDDHGSFRLAGLPSGPYFLSASDPAFDRAGDVNGPLRYGPTYYPSVALVDQATALDVVAGDEPAVKATITLQVIHPLKVSGVIHTDERRQLLSAAIIMNPIDGDALGTWPARDVRIQPTGPFAFSNVPPGRYLIRARADIEVQGIAHFGAFAVTVENRDVDGIDIVLQPGEIVSGTVVAESAAAQKPGSLVGLRVRAPFLDGSVFGDALTGDVRADGGFRIRGVMSGVHTFIVEGLRPPWVLKSVVHRGQNIIDTGFTAISGQQMGDVRITITDVASTVSGVVRDGTGAVVSNALVVVAPAAQQFWMPASRHIGVARTDAAGRYEIRGLPDGDYHAVASGDLAGTDAYSHTVLTTIDRSGARLSLSGLEQRTVDLVVMSSAQLKRTAPPQ